MAVFVPAPGVGQFQITGHIGQHKFNQVWHFKSPASPAPWVASDMLTICNAIMNDLKTGFQGLFYSNVTYNSVAAVDLTNSTPATAVSTAPTWTGTGAGEMAPSLATMVQFKIADRYRGGKPRTYFPAMAATNSNTADDGWLASAVTNFNNAMATQLAAIQNAVLGVIHCSPRYTYTVVDDPAHHRYIRTKATFIDAPGVAQYVTSPVIRSQRRRMTSAA